MQPQEIEANFAKLGELIGDLHGVSPEHGTGEAQKKLAEFSAWSEQFSASYQSLTDRVDASEKGLKALVERLSAGASAPTDPVDGQPAENAQPGDAEPVVEPTADQVEQAAS